ncbi:MAG: hypothetical protein IPM79_30100 [Polyangiaceae bacterium]|nr:hypothetical protein [Polyangiaceae bacterium]
MSSPTSAKTGTGVFTACSATGVCGKSLATGAAVSPPVPPPAVPPPPVPPPPTSACASLNFASSSGVVSPSSSAAFGSAFSAATRSALATSSFCWPTPWTVARPMCTLPSSSGEQASFSLVQVSTAFLSLPSALSNSTLR